MNMPADGRVNIGKCYDYRDKLPGRVKLRRNKTRAKGQVPADLHCQHCVLDAWTGLKLLLPANKIQSGLHGFFDFLRGHCIVCS